MSEYIEREVLRKLMFSYYECVNEETSKGNYHGETLMAYEVAGMIDDCIDNTPAADVAPVVHERWESVPGYPPHFKRCSNCWEESNKLTNYCPSCGAKMDL